MKTCPQDNATWSLKWLVNIEEDREPPVTIAVGRERGRNVVGELNETVMTSKEMQESVKEMKTVKAAGLDTWMFGTMPKVLQ